jgi:8-oxo-dGTP pyrophosphatase MutT (NUDIX family)
MPYTPAGLFYKLVLYPLARLYWCVLRPEILEVRCLVEHGGRVLLVRSTYGRMMWDLPGGGAGRSEPPEEAARREVREEVGLTITGVRRLKVLRAGEGGRIFGTVVFSARAEASELKPRRAEIYDEGWFEWESLPRPLSPAAARIMGLYRSGGLALGSADSEAS